MRRLVRTAVAAVALALTAAVPTATAAPGGPGVERVDTGSDGSQFSTYVYGGPVSANGRFAAFTATGPAPDCPASGSGCVYLKDLRTGALIRVPDTQYYASGPLLSADARIVAYSSGNRFTKPYVHDRATGRTQQLWPADGGGRYELGTAQAVSANGRYVAYTIGSRTPPEYESVLYVRDLVTGTDTQVLAPPLEGQLTGVMLSADGRTLAYGMLVPGGFDRTGRVYVEDLDSGVTVRADSDDYGDSTLAALSADGRRVVIGSRSYPDGVTSARLVDLAGGHVRRLGLDGVLPVAADPAARHVLLTDDTYALSLLDVRTGGRRTVTTSAALAVPGSVSSGGRAVEFRSEAPDLVPDDTNDVADVFVSHPG
ncbi:WD40 repeat domain-containing protein [Streptomyces sp. NPDC085900]|uniref:WD40 repeat domain-containing protein n=1 Tax=Streptomyces sp. NPDC085900 TaxID=3365737 RepID=UPI0037D25882